MSSETRILLGTIDTRQKSAELNINPPKKARILDIFRNPFAKRQAAPIDLDTEIAEVVTVQKIDNTEIIAPDVSPKLEFRLLAQRIKGVSNENREQILKTINLFHLVNLKAEQDGNTKLPIIAIAQGVRQGNVGEVEDVAAEHVPFNQMPEKDGLYQTTNERNVQVMAYQVQDENPLAHLQIDGPLHHENETKLALLQQRAVRTFEHQPEQKGMTAVIMIDDELPQIEQSNEPSQIDKHNFFLEDQKAA